ncbi:MAG TPA: hypothetical protein VJY15_11280 [Candidatus Acidoferrum sp.]|nr:hypothetical protein [Candidatus Acidoferrum sp.]
MKVAPEIIAALCRKRAPDVLTPANWEGTPLDKVQLLWGIAGVESSFGFNCSPKHEPGYCHGGRYFDFERTKEWGCLAHCSFGPWQVMFAHFPLSVSPLSLMWETDGQVAADVCLRGAVSVLNRAIARGVRNLGEIVVAYNGPANEAGYASILEACLAKPMPQSAAEVAT